MPESMEVRSFYLFVILLMACQSSDRDRLNSKVLHYNQPNYITSLDPAFAKSQNNIWAVDHIYNQLVGLDSSLNLMPEIASAWQISDDRKTYTFSIRKGIGFHKNSCFGKDSLRYLNASDVVYSFSRLIDTILNPPGSWVFLGKVDTDSPFLAPNDSTFILKLKEPFAPIMQILTMQYCSILPQEAVAYYKDDFRKNPVGTGPFMLKKWIDRSGMFLSRNSSFFLENQSNLDGIRISFMEDRSIAYLELLKGKIDFFSGINSSFSSQLFDDEGNLRDESQSKFHVLKNDFLNTEYIGINLNAVHENHILRNADFRRALSLSIDKNLLVKTLRNGVGTPAESGFIPKGLPSFSLQKRKFIFNKSQAVTLVQKAAYDFANPLHKLTVYTNKDYIDIITFVAKQWQNIGINVAIELLETATLREKMKKGELMMFRASWIADYPDEESFMNVFYSQNAAPPNYTRFNNTNFDKAYIACVQETDPDLRDSLFVMMNDIIMEENPVIPLFYDQSVWVFSKYIFGLKSNSINLLSTIGVKELN